MWGIQLSRWIEQDDKIFVTGNKIQPFCLKKRKLYGYDCNVADHWQPLEDWLGCTNDDPDDGITETFTVMNWKVTFLFCWAFCPSLTFSFCQFYFYSFAYNIIFLRVDTCNKFYCHHWHLVCNLLPLFWQSMILYHIYVIQ